MHVRVLHAVLPALFPPEGQQPLAIRSNGHLVGHHLANAAILLVRVDHLQHTKKQASALDCWRTLLLEDIQVLLFIANDAQLCIAWHSQGGRYLAKAWQKARISFSGFSSIGCYGRTITQEACLGGRPEVTAVVGENHLDVASASPV